MDFFTYIGSLGVVLPLLILAAVISWLTRRKRLAELEERVELLETSGRRTDARNATRGLRPTVRRRYP